MSHAVLAPTSHFKVYEPRLVAEEEGKATYKQVLVPRTTNAVAIPPVSFSFFDPEEQIYRTLVRGPFPLAYLAEREQVAFDRYRPEAPESDGGGGAGWAQRLASMARTHNRGAGGAGPEARLAMASLAYWIAAILAAVVVAMKRRGRMRLLAAGLLVVAALVFRPYRAGMRTLATPAARGVVTQAESVRFAPSHGSVQSFGVTEGTVVRILETDGEWAKIASGTDRGWLPISSMRAE